jgi:hypothetical protein
MKRDMPPAELEPETFPCYKWQTKRRRYTAAPSLFDIFGALQLYKYVTRVAYWGSHPHNFGSGPARRLQAHLGFRILTDPPINLQVDSKLIHVTSPRIMRACDHVTRRSGRKRRKRCTFGRLGCLVDHMQGRFHWRGCRPPELFLRAVLGTNAALLIKLSQIVHVVDVVADALLRNT